MEGYVYAQVIVEGSTDIPVVTALMYAAGWAESEFSVTSANGKGAIDRDIKKYWEAARVLPYVIFRDLDQDGEGCPVTRGTTSIRDRGAQARQGSDHSTRRHDGCVRLSLHVHARARGPGSL